MRWLLLFCSWKRPRGEAASQHGALGGGGAGVRGRSPPQAAHPESRCPGGARASARPGLGCRPSSLPPGPGRGGGEPRRFPPDWRRCLHAWGAGCGMQAGACTLCCGDAAGACVGCMRLRVAFWLCSRCTPPPTRGFLPFAPAGTHGIPGEVEGLVAEVSGPVQSAPPALAGGVLSSSLPLHAETAQCPPRKSCTALCPLQAVTPCPSPRPPGTAHGSPRRTSWMRACWRPSRRGTAVQTRGR